MLPHPEWILTMVARVFLAAVLTFVASARSAAGQQTGEATREISRPLAPGIDYLRCETGDPRPMVVHIVRVDTREQGIRFRVTPRCPEWQENRTETLRQTTRRFLQAGRAAGRPVVVAVNGDAFSPWPAPFAEESPTDLLGLAVSDGVLVSPPSGTPSLICQADGSLAIRAMEPGADLGGIDQAISGFAICLAEGRPLTGGDALHPRTGIGLSDDGRWLVMVVIDGRQPASRGATTEELGAWLLRGGAMTGINLDGGGSSTLAWWDGKAPGRGRARLLNSPVGAGGDFSGLPARLFLPTERAVGNSFAVLREEVDGPAAPGWRPDPAEGMR